MIDPDSLHCKFEDLTMTDFQPPAQPHVSTKPLTEDPFERRSGVHCSVARTRPDFEAAFELLARRYKASGLAGTSPHPLRLLPYHLWHQTRVMVARAGSGVVGSVTLIQEGSETLPIETSYGGLIGQLRAQGKRIGEVCSLAVEGPDHCSSGEVFALLTRRMMFQARHAGIDVLVAIVHPRHAAFYRRAMGFEIVGEVAPCQHVEGRPGIPILGMVNEPQRYRSRWQRYYFEGDIDSSELPSPSMSQIDRVHFGRVLQEITNPAAARRAA